MQIENANVWIFETSKLTFRNVFDEGVIIVPWQLLRWNRWMKPPRVSVTEFHNLTCDVMADSYGMLGKGRGVLQQSVKELNAILKVTEDEPCPWTDIDLVHKMEENRRQSKHRDEKDTYTRWLERLRHYLGFSTLFTEECFDLARLMTCNVVWELHAFPRTLRCDIINSMLAYKFAYKLRHPEATKQLCVNFIDEASSLIAEDQISLTQSYVFTCMKQTREYSETFVIGDQKVMHLKELLDLPYAVTVFQQSDFSAPFFARHSTLSKEGAVQLTNLPVGRLVSMMPCKPPVEVQTPLQTITKRRTDEDIHREMAPVLERFLIRSLKPGYGPRREVHVEKEPFLEKRSELHVKPDEEVKAKEALRFIGENSRHSKTDIFNAIDVRHEYGYRILAIIEKRKHVEGPVEIPSKRGRSRECYLLTEAGAGHAGLDWETVRLRGKGGPTAKIYAKIIHDWLEHNQGSPSYEFKLTVGDRGKACDVADLSDLTAYEIEATGDLDSAYSNIRKDFQVGFTKVVIVVKDGRVKNSLDRMFRDCLDPWDLDRVEVKPIKEFC
jgi:hypothetical protein